MPEFYQSITNLDECIAQSQTQPVFILKHSITCPISARAKKVVDAYLQKHKQTAYLIVVQNERALSNQTAERFTIKHESPQLLLILQGDVKGVLNHNQITEANIQSLVST